LPPEFDLRFCGKSYGGLKFLKGRLKLRWIFPKIFSIITLWEFITLFKKSYRVLFNEISYKSEVLFLPQNFSSRIWNFELLTLENFDFNFAHDPTLVPISWNLNEFSRMSYITGRRYNFYPNFFPSRIWNFELLTLENFDFNFNHSQNSVPPLRGLTEFFQVSFLIKLRYNFYPKNFSSRIWNFELLTLENFDLNFDHG
jgi:hypothetical protein